MIPLQLKDCSFNRVLKRTKKPFELDWTNKPYTYQQINQYFPNENYGVMTGINNLGVLDDDSEDKILIKMFEELFKESFRVRDHYYINLIGWDGKKIIFFDDGGKHLGELQGLGQMVVGPGSIHPSGDTYTLIKDIPIKEIHFENFKSCFKDLIPKEKRKNEYEGKTKWEGDNISNITISSIISLASLKSMGNSCYQGEHPEHGSSGGMNFRVDSLNNVWYCFRCTSGGGPSELIGVMEGVISCSEAGGSCYSSDQAKQVIELARKNYGLRTPEPKEKLEVRGWANSVSIVNLAKKYNLENCPECMYAFTFKDKFGMYYCKTCKKGGGLTKFAALCSGSKGVSNE